MLDVWKDIEMVKLMEMWKAGLWESIEAARKAVHLVSQLAPSMALLWVEMRGKWLGHLTAES